MNIDPWLRVFVVGKTQSGKSHLVKTEIIPKLQNVIIVDIKREYGAFGVVVTDLRGVAQACYDGVRRVVYQPMDLSYGTMESLCAWVRDHLRNWTLVIDELQNWCTSSYIPPALKWVVCTGQGEPYRLGLVAVTQRPANVHNDVKSNSSLYIVFRLFLQADAAAISESTGILEDRLRGLAQHHFLVYDDRAASGCEIVAYPPVR